jgi:hypothetical protein
MSYQIRVVLIGILAVLAFDTIASLAARGLGFPYTRASVGSYLLYFAIGFFAARGSSHPLQAAAVAAGIAGLADASLGWFISWKLEAAKLPAGTTLTPGRWLNIAIIVIVLAAAIGTIGGAVGRRHPTRESPSV